MKTIGEIIKGLIASPGLSEAERTRLGNVLAGKDDTLTMWELTKLELKAKGLK